MAVPEIRELESLLKDVLGDIKITKSTTKYLTAKGDNYGSTILSLDLTVQKNGSFQDIHAVAKCLPESEFIRNAIDAEKTVKKEMIFYRDIVPALIDLQKEYGLPEDKLLENAFPKYYGGRPNLNNSDKVDDDSVIVIENVSYLGYQTGNRLVGCDLDEARFVLKHWGRLQATIVALKLLKPRVFRSTVLPYLQPLVFGSENLKNDMSTYADQLETFFSTFEDIKPYVKQIGDIIRKAYNMPHNLIEPRQPFAGIGHNDFWLGNFMMTKENGKPSKIMFIDFQFIFHSSPINDILFFFYTSIQEDVLQPNFDYFLDFYHSNFVDCLKEFGIDVSPFSREAFLKELDELAVHVLGHIFFIIRGVLTDKEKIKDIDVTEAGHFTLDILAPVYFKRVVNMIREYIKRGWLK